MAKAKCERCGLTENLLYSQELDANLCKQCAEKQIEECQIDAQAQLYEADVWKSLLQN